MTIPIRTSKYSQKGQTLIIVTVLFTAGVLALVFGALAPLIRDTQTVRDLQMSKQSYFTAESGADDGYWRVYKGLTTSFPETLALNNATATVTAVTVGVNEQVITSTGNANNLIRVVTNDVIVSNGFSFHSAIQTGIGGITMKNGAAVNGNIYTSGPVTSTNGNPNSYNVVKGSVVSSGPSGTVSNIHSTSSVYAHTMHDITVDGDAYYQSFAGATSSVTVTGTKHPNSADQPNVDFPITDSLISDWENNAASGGLATCSGGTYSITSSTTTGPKKIPCNLSITGNGTVVTLTGTLWVLGNITISGSGGSGVQLKVADSLGDKSVAVIADNPSDTTGSGQVTIDDKSFFYGSTGNANSYVLVISQNKSYEQGGSNIAINVVNGATGNLLIYAMHGEIELQNSVHLREVTAYHLTLINNTVVDYVIGLAQSLFTTGAGGSWKIKHWKESF